MTPGNMVGRSYLLDGQAVTVVVQWRTGHGRPEEPAHPLARRSIRKFRRGSLARPVRGPLPLPPGDGERTPLVKDGRRGREFLLRSVDSNEERWAGTSSPHR